MGKIIVFEGLDCSFKETNSKALEDFLKNNGEKVKLFSFPAYKSKEDLHFLMWIPFHLPELLPD